MTLLLLLDIEDAFNEIWGVKKRRSMLKRLPISLAIIIVCPVFLIGTSVVNAFLASNVQSIPLLRGSSRFLISISQYGLVGLVFAGVYTFVPYTKVRFFPALMSGLGASVAWHITQWVFIEFQVGVSRYNAIYGTFASLPLFLLWIYTSWFIILFGCEFTFASQNERKYAEEKFANSVSYRLVEQLALGIYFLIYRRFVRQHEPYSAEQISRFFDAPIRIVQDILYKLGQSGLVEEVEGNKKNPVEYIPGPTAGEIKPLDVVNALQNYGVDKILQSEDKNIIMKEIHNLFDKRQELLSGSEFNRPFKDLVKE
jgi:membrane protein